MPAIRACVLLIRVATCCRATIKYLQNKPQETINCISKYCCFQFRFHLWVYDVHTLSHAHGAMSKSITIYSTCRTNFPMHISARLIPVIFFAWAELKRPGYPVLARSLRHGSNDIGRALLGMSANIFLLLLLLAIQFACKIVFFIGGVLFRKSCGVKSTTNCCVIHWRGK